MAAPDRVRHLSAMEPRRVCLIKPSALGDVVHALPVLSALRARWPDAHIAWVVNRGFRSLIEGHPDLDEVIPFDRGAARFSASGIGEVARFARRLRLGRFDLTIDLQGLLRSGLMTAATGAPVRVGLAEAREGSRRFYTHEVSTLGPGRSPHIVDRLMTVAHAFGAAVAGPRFILPPDAEAERWAAEALRDVPKPRLIVNLGARWVTKRWAPESFAVVAGRAADRLGAGIVAVGSADDRPIVDAFLRHVRPVPALDLCGRTTLPQLAALAAAADLFLSNDTGPLHVAAAVGVPTVAVFTCSDSRKTAPYAANATVVATEVWCAATCVKTCPRLDCMAELTPDRVWRAVESRLRAGPSPSRRPSAA